MTDYSRLENSENWRIQALCREILKVKPASLRDLLLFHLNELDREISGDKKSYREFSRALNTVIQMAGDLSAED